MEKHLWLFNSDGEKTVQCGHVHFVALISEDVIHGANSTFALCVYDDICKLQDC